ncbi:ABC transporter permease [Carboxydothermus hydrogenoformans]|uniref:Oligopeptide ABC transporter, permease protein n=1 Tax=Carboxydothermus hydrogenoformans (strain ATCC BAA-161 / DSM 6008 / Z-2901) TaxID=246194 RepID=Q3A9M3_CARHZ|nr:ABC transporter permease [Carboxydothermus hydrogenoformans]ABB15904.1 oligopeptide ABC transporter, permease protein [Carboxydothermus hydrogenoformans Z-2901]
MFAIIRQRIFSGIIAVWLIATITFFLMHSIPGGPFTDAKKLPPEVEKNLMAKYHLDQPLLKQYEYYMLNLLKGDLGVSIKYEGRTVNEIIKDGFPVSASLGFIALLIAVTFGVLLGIISALKKNSILDYISVIIATIGFSVPSFILATLLMYIFALKLNLLPAALWETPANAILPSISLAFLPMAFITRMVRANLLEELEKDYIKTARAKGLSEKTVIFKHALKNAILPVVTYLGPMAAGIFTGSFVIEKIFVIPGLGRDFVTSITNRDYTVIMGLTIFYSVLLIFMNLLVDISYGFIDPRIKLGKGE